MTTKCSVEAEEDTRHWLKQEHSQDPEMSALKKQAATQTCQQTGQTHGEARCSYDSGDSLPCRFEGTRSLH